MQNLEEFRRHLKRKGKRDHVVDDLLRRCSVFQEFLHKKRKTSMDSANKEDVLAYFDAIKDQKRGINNDLRAIDLYYGFTSNKELCALAGNLREQRIASNRKPFKLKKFRGTNKRHIMLLEKEEVTNVNQMLERGKTPHDRKELSKKTGIPLESILEYVKLSDLSRLGGVKGIRARLYLDAGVDTLDKMASWNPEELRTYLIGFVKRTSFKGIAPLPKEMRNTVKTAKRIKRIVEYDE
jgi:hypothetical protein